MGEQKNYRAEAINDAADMVEEFLSEIIDDLRAHGSVSTDVDRYSESYFHETFVDQEFGFREGVEVIEQLSEFEASDSGLFGGEGMRDMVSGCAAYTYGNAVRSMYTTLIKEINEDHDVQTALLVLELRELDHEDMSEDQQREYEELEVADITEEEALSELSRAVTSCINGSRK